MMIKKQHTFQIEYLVESEQRTYEGKFTSKIASVADKSRIAIKKSQLCGGMYCVRDDDNKPTGRGIDEETEWTNHMLAYLDIVLVQKPDWWKLEEIVDYGLILKVFQEVMAHEGTFRSGGKPDTTAGGNQPAQGGEGTSSTKSAVADGGNAPKKVVDQQVQAALDA